MASPPLPDVLPAKVPSTSQASDGPPLGPSIPPITFPPWPWPRFRFIRSGSWLINYQPLNSANVSYDGTIRIENNASGRTASGDLYQRPIILIPGGPFPPTRPPILWLRPPPDPANGIPILGRSRYRYYLRITKIDEFISIGNTFELGIQMYRFASTSKTSFTFTKDASDYTATMTWMAAPAGYPSSPDYVEGDVKADTTGAVAGRLKMGWVSEFYRKCTVELDTVTGSEHPLDNGAGQDWHTVFSNVGFDMTIEKSDTDVREESGASWSNAELHKAMLERRDRINLDAEWHYHILAVKLLDEPAFGIMYDWMATDSNNVAREGVAIGSETRTPTTDDWGTEKDKRFEDAKMAYLRTAIHELGHAFGLQHNVAETDNSFMNRTLTIVSKGTPSNPFPNNIKWNYADENLLQLRHWPDIFIRPGGVEFTYATNANPPITPADTTVEIPGLDLAVEPLLAEVPLGAPVRVNVKLTNKGKEPVLVPGNISLKSGYISGAVTDPSGTARSFRPFVCYDRQELPKPLGPDESISASLTLLRGGQGALFPTTGIAEITAKVSWGIAGSGLAAEAFVTSSTTVMVTPAVEKSHAAAAHKLLTTPDAHLVLVLGGDHPDKGVEAIRQVLDCEALRPHFACIEARRRAEKFFDRAADAKAAEGFIRDGEVVMSRDERTKLEKLGVKCG